MLKLYNTLTQKKQEFKPLKGKEITLYNCGPTVYARPHIGNLSSFLFPDLLKRYLEFNSYKVKQVMNITDVDDKTIKGSLRTGVSLETYTKPFVDNFFQDLRKLNIKPADYYPRATEYINEIVNLVKKLLDKGYAYKGEDGSIYFRISKFPRYGRLVRLKKQSLKVGARVSSDDYNKQEASDFALWKAWNPSDGDVFWDTELGKGRPGWHIECSAMSTSLLGETIDIHTGAIDLKFPHHTNEIAQSEGATGKQFVRFWLHRSFLRMGQEKMAKRLGNILTLDNLMDKGHLPRTFRYLVLTSHYRTPLVYSEAAMKAAKKSLENIDEFIRRLKGVKQTKEKYKIDLLIERAYRNFQKYLDDDLNTPRAISVIFNFIRRINKEIDKENLNFRAARKALDFLKDIDQVWGFLFEESKEERVLSKEEKKLLEERAEARKNKDYTKADRIREELLEKGIEVRDEKNGKQIWVFKK